MSARANAAQRRRAARPSQERAIAKANNCRRRPGRAPELSSLRRRSLGFAVSVRGGPTGGQRVSRDVSRPHTREGAPALSPMTAAAVVASSADAFLRALAQRAPSHADRPSCCSPSASAASPAAARRRHAGLARRRGPAPLAAAGASSSSSSSSSDGGERLDALQQRANQIRAMKAAANYLELLKDEDVDLEVSPTSFPVSSVLAPARPRSRGLLREERRARPQGSSAPASAGGLSRPRPWRPAPRPLASTNFRGAGGTASCGHRRDSAPS